MPQAMKVVNNMPLTPLCITLTNFRTFWGSNSLSNMANLAHLMRSCKLLARRRRRRMNCSATVPFSARVTFEELVEGCVLSAFFLSVLMAALLELLSCRSQNHCCGLLGIWPLSCQRLKCCPLCYVLDVSPVLDCSLGTGPQGELLLAC